MNSSNLSEGLTIGRPNLDCHPSLCFCFGFLVIRTSLLGPLAVTTVVGFLDLRKVSNSSELGSCLLIVCIDAPDSTANTRSSRDFEVGACITLASIEE